VFCEKKHKEGRKAFLSDHDIIIFNHSLTELPWKEPKQAPKQFMMSITLSLSFPLSLSLSHNEER